MSIYGGREIYYRDKICRILDSKEEHNTNKCCIRSLLMWEPCDTFQFQFTGIFITNIWGREARILILMFADDTKLRIVTDTPKGCATITRGLD